MRRRRSRWGWPTLVTIFVLASCGDDANDQQGIAAELVAETDGALDESQADCVAAGLVSAFGDASFRDLVDAAEGSGDDADDVRVEVIDIFTACDALDAVVLSGSSADAPG